MTVTRPVLRWHGGKWRLAPWILEHFPAHDVYVEPFGGAASVLMRKPKSYAEVYNDLDGDVVNLFRIMRSHRADELVSSLLLTPFARDEFVGAYQPTSDDLERARRLVIRSFMGFGSNSHNRPSGFRSNSNRSGTTPAHDWAAYPDSLAAAIDRFSGVVVENRDATEVMKQHDGQNTLFYVDPPYMAETRDRGRDYRHEMSDADHSDLLDALLGLRGMVVLSGYPHHTYDNALADWHRAEKQALADGARQRTEVLWINPACAQRLHAEKLPLLDGAA